MHIYSKNKPAKFHPDPTCNDAALGILDHVEERLLQEEQDE